MVSRRAWARGDVIGFGTGIADQAVLFVPTAIRDIVASRVAVPGWENSAFVKGESGNTVATARRTRADVWSAPMLTMPRIWNEALVDVEP